MYDENDLETSSSANASTYVYHIQATKLLEGPVTSKVLVTKNTKAQITVELSDEVQLSSKPIRGTFRISCPIEGNDLADDPIATDDIKYNDWWRNVQNALFNKCPDMFDKVEVWDSMEYPFRDNGIGLYVRFANSNGPKTQMQILPGVDDPLTGEELEFRSIKVVPASDNLYYDVVPFEMLRTVETKPQVIMTIDGLPAVCHNLTCDFTYVEPKGEVTGFNYINTTRELQIFGVDLP